MPTKVGENTEGKMSRTIPTTIAQWSVMTFRMLRWKKFIDEKIAAVRQLPQFHPKRRNAHEKWETELRAERCRHPVASIYQGANASGKWETCQSCGIRLSYVAEIGGTIWGQAREGVLPEGAY